MKTVCHRCGAEWSSETALQPGVKEACEKCGAYLHCCLNCKFYDTSKPYDCYVPNIEPVTDKEGANFCDDFTFRVEGAKEDPGNKPGRESFDALFGDEPDDDGGPSSFGDLFKE